MKKFIAATVLLIGAQNATANSFLSAQTDVPFVGSVKNERMALLAVGCIFAYVKNHEKETRDIVAEGIKGIALEEIFGRVISGSVTPGSVNTQVKRFAPSNKTALSVAKDSLKAVVKHIGVNPAVDFLNNSTK
jgi:hypothetical protein